MSAYGMVDVEWRCPACSSPQSDPLFWAGTTNRARANVKCAGCERTILFTLAACIRVVEPAAEEGAKDGEG